MTGPDAAAVAAAEQAITDALLTRHYSEPRFADYAAARVIAAVRPLIEAEARASERISYEITTEGGHVVLNLPDRGMDLLFDPATALALGAAFQAASRDIPRDSLDGDTQPAEPVDDREAEFNRYAYDEQKFRP